MILAGGVADDERGERRYGLFASELFGLQPTLQQLVEYFAAAAAGLEVRKRILLLMGPVWGCELLPGK